MEQMTIQVQRTWVDRIIDMVEMFPEPVKWVIVGMIVGMILLKVILKVKKVLNG